MHIHPITNHTHFSGEAIEDAALGHDIGGAAVGGVEAPDAVGAGGGLVLLFCLCVEEAGSLRSVFMFGSVPCAVGLLDGDEETD